MISVMSTYSVGEGDGKWLVVICVIMTVRTIHISCSTSYYSIVPSFSMIVYSL